MAKTRAQRKAEQRRRQQQAGDKPVIDTTEDTAIGETADVIEAELAERGIPLEELTGKPGEETPAAPAPSRADVPATAEPEPTDRISRRAQRQAEKERKAKAKESERRRAPKAAAPVEKRQRVGVLGFLASCWAELKRVQWPDRETLVQATAVTIIFVAVAAAYLGALDALFNLLIKRIL